MSKRKKHLSLAAILLAYCCHAFSQAKSGLENYNRVSNDRAYSWMPIAHYQAQNGFYTELRYNYEDVKTVSIYCGNRFLIGKKKEDCFHSNDRRVAGNVYRGIGGIQAGR